jgi:hypothetical protein
MLLENRLDKPVISRYAKQVCSRKDNQPLASMDAVEGQAPLNFMFSQVPSEGRVWCH